jgi:hypothetical protein
MRNTHLLQTEQWWVRIGLISLHVLHFFVQEDSSAVMVLLRYFSKRLTSFDIPSKRSSSTNLEASSLLDDFSRMPFLPSLFLSSFLICSIFYIRILKQQLIKPTLRSAGPPGLMTIAKKWL